MFGQLKNAHYFYRYSAPYTAVSSLALTLNYPSTFTHSIRFLRVVQLALKLGLQCLPLASEALTAAGQCVELTGYDLVVWQTTLFPTSYEYLGIEVSAMSEMGEVCQLPQFEHELVHDMA